MADGAECEDSEWQEAIISLAPFATARGGAVHFGISQDGRRVGVQHLNM